LEIRVIEATHRDPGKAERESFGQVLLYRLSVVALRLPRLRQRTRDIPLLVEWFLEPLDCQRKLRDECMEMLMTWVWLRAGTAKLHRADSGEELGPLLQTADLPSALRTHVGRGRAGWFRWWLWGYPARVGCWCRGKLGIIPLTEMEKRAIRDALKDSKGDQVKAASCSVSPLSIAN